MDYELDDKDYIYPLSAWPWSVTIWRRESEEVWARITYDRDRDTHVLSVGEAGQHEPFSVRFIESLDKAIREGEVYL